VSVSEAVDAYLADRDLAGNGTVLAAVAKRLAGQLDAACESDTARGLSAAPPLARRLVEVVEELARREAIEAERQEREARVEERRRNARWAA
jgi:hypothetical protein